MSGFEAWIGNCHLRQIEGEEEYHCQAAVWANSSDTFRARLAQHIESSGLKILWLEETLSASQYLHRHGNPHKIGALARAVHPQHHVELSRLVAVSSCEPEPPQNYLIIEEIEGVEPLDLQFGIHPRKTVPDSLYEPLFGQPEPTEAEIAHYGSAEAVPPMRTYAVLNASRMPYLLTSHIEGSELPYRCLFIGQAQEDLKEHAPYLVEMQDNNGFVEKLFTGPQGVLGLWEKTLGIYLRTRSDFEEVWRHFRKFNRAQDRNEKWYFLRLYEPSALEYHLDGIKKSSTRVSHLFAGRMSHPLHCMMTVNAEKSRMRISRPIGQIAQSDAITSPLIATGDGAQTLDPKYTERFLREAISFLRKKDKATEEQSEDALLSFARDQIEDFYALGVSTVPVTGCALGIVLRSKKTLNNLPDTHKSFLMHGKGSQYKRYNHLFQHLLEQAH